MYYFFKLYFVLNHLLFWITNEVFIVTFSILLFSIRIDEKQDVSRRLKISIRDIDF